MRIPTGLVILNKEEGMTSQTAVSRVRRLFGADKAGHSGTLDPLATGLLVLFFGRATKAVEYAEADDKEYTAGIRFGLYFSF